MDFDGDVKWHTTKSPYFPFSGVRRGECEQCKTPVGSVGYGIVGLMSFVNASLFRIKPSHCMHFNSRDKELTAEDARPEGTTTYWTDFVSINMFVLVFLKACILNLFCIKTILFEEAEPRPTAV